MIRNNIMTIINAFTSPYFMFGESVTASDVQNCIQVSEQDLGADISMYYGKEWTGPRTSILSYTLGILPFVHPISMYNRRKRARCGDCDGCQESNDCGMCSSALINQNLENP